MNNPVYFVDPDGMSTETFTGDAAVLWALSWGDKLDKAKNSGMVLDVQGNMRFDVDYLGIYGWSAQNGGGSITNNVKEYLDRAGLWNSDKDEPVDIYSMDYSNRKAFIITMIRTVEPLTILARAAGLIDKNGNVVEDKIAYKDEIKTENGYLEGSFGPDNRILSITSSAFINTRELFRVLVHEITHAWDINSGYLSKFNGYSLLAKYSVARAVTEVRAYQMQMWFGLGVTDRQKKYYDIWYSIATDKNILQNFQIKHYPTFFYNIQKK